MTSNEVKTREQFVAFLQTFRADLENEAPYWQNLSLEAFLEAMAYWIEHRMTDFYEQEGKPTPKSETWKTLADILYVGAIYE